MAVIRVRDSLNTDVPQVQADSRIAEVLAQIQPQQQTDVAVFCQDKFCGLVRSEDIQDAPPQQLLEDLLTESQPTPVSAETLVEEAIRLFSRPSIRALPVVETTGNFLGIVTQQTLLESLVQEMENTNEEIRQLRASAEQSLAQEKQTVEQVKQLRDELAHIMRRAMMGELATELAHEVYQPLSAITLYAAAGRRLLLADPIDIEELSHVMEKVEAEANRAGKIVHWVRAFVKKRVSKFSPVDINDTTTEVTKLVEREVEINEIQVKTDLADQLPLVLADQIQIEQVLLNIMRNAIEAMSDPQCKKRNLTIRTALVETNEVEITVSDTGKGLPPENLQDLFEPFYTTKDDGMGMGLAITGMIIEAHQGHISATLNDDGGLTFRILLPRSSR